MRIGILMNRNLDNKIHIFLMVVTALFVFGLIYTIHNIPERTYNVRFRNIDGNIVETTCALRSGNHCTNLYRCLDGHDYICIKEIQIN